MIVGLAFIVGAMMLYFNFIRPAYGDSQEIKSRQLGQRLFLTEQQDTIRKVQALISEYQTQLLAQEAVSLALPTKEDVGGGLAQLYGIARNSGLNMQSVSISVAGIGGAQTTGAAPSFALQKPLGTIVFRARLVGGYEDLKRFLGFLETNIRIFDLDTLSLRPLGVGDGAAGSFTYEISVATYYQRPE